MIVWLVFYSPSHLPSPQLSLVNAMKYPNKFAMEKNLQSVSAFSNPVLAGSGTKNSFHGPWKTFRSSLFIPTK